MANSWIKLTQTFMELTTDSEFMELTTDSDELEIAFFLKLFSIFLYMRYLDRNWQIKNNLLEPQIREWLLSEYLHNSSTGLFLGSGSGRDQTGSRCERISRTSLAMFNNDSPLTKWVLASSLYLCLRYLCNMFKWRSCSLAALALSLTTTRSAMS